MNSTDKTQTNHPASGLYDFVELLVIAICTVLVLFSFGFRLCRVSGDSMNQTLHNGEMLLISSCAYTPKQGDIVVFHQTHEIDTSLNEPIVKRVIATEGQHVKVDYATAKVYVSDDEIFDENDVIEESYDYVEGGVITRPFFANNKHYEVPKGHIFVLGDNRNNSRDSRDTYIGFVDTRRILGKVVLRITPFSKFGLVE
ncbi:MAG: signal peptidase I [Clostridia bacterium]|nr:signal peptidase I [Clostridia bacterium]